jgi:hypothetical protein
MVLKGVIGSYRELQVVTRIEDIIPVTTCNSL